ncbi:MAG: bifunctional UDP-4-keto-pentose/UDP-xylose synthase [Holosporales bacterium]|jgi:nucleoside-diphosphate-sugar epimerase|nr:bifunctional UDP-4-keto-pentose/UDP-xylose synthase [Holosporales bacterium]
MALKVLILGVNGFIGNHLTESILENEDWEVFGMDLGDDKIKGLLQNPRFHFVEGDITINYEWISYHIRKCDVVLPLVAIATPATYVTHPLRVFELDFEANLHIIRKVVQYKKRLIFPSTSEVYGMCQDKAFNEETSSLVVGPINKQRWIYSCSKQLIDRVVYAYGAQEELSYTLFRPFNFIGPKLDTINEQKEGSSRSIAQFISDILYRGEIKLVNGGTQHRCFTYISDGIDALVRIIRNQDGCASQRIFNIGNPTNDVSVKELAERVVALAQNYPKIADLAKKVKITPVSAEDYYGPSYQDASFRVPSIENAQKYLGWTPKVSLEEALRRTLDFYFA